MRISIGLGLKNIALKWLMRNFVLLIVFAIAYPQLAGAEQFVLSDDDLARLQRGEVLFQDINSEKPGVAARVTALLHTDAAEVWDIIGHCKYELIYVRGLKFCELLEGDQFQMTVHHRVRNSWYSPTLDFVFKASRELAGTGKASLVSGDLKILEGLWYMSSREEENGVIVTHELRVQPKLPAPKWLVRRTFRKDLPDMMACIRGLANASANDRDLERDLKRCPGDISSLAK